MSTALPHDGASWVVECDMRPDNKGIKMEAKHTLEPWHCANVSAKTGHLGVYGQDGSQIALLKVPSALYSDRRGADARLIAAAPSLLAALRELVRICERCDADGPMADACGEDEYQAAMDAAEDAIALALMTGRGNAQQQSKQVAP